MFEDFDPITAKAAGWQLLSNSRYPLIVALVLRVLLGCNPLSWGAITVWIGVKQQGFQGFGSGIMGGEKAENASDQELLHSG